MHKLSNDEVRSFVAPYIGKVIRSVRQGHGSAIFLEVEDLTIMVEWSWRVEKGNEIAFGSWSDDSFFPALLSELNGKFIQDISFQARLPELVLELSDNTWLCSFSTVEGDPEWAQKRVQHAPQFMGALEVKEAPYENFNLNIVTCT